MTDTQLRVVEDAESQEDLTPEQLAARVAELEGRLAQAGRDFIAFKANVRQEAMVMAEQHGLCDVVEQTLTKIGINSTFKRIKVTTTIERTRTFDVPDDLLATYSDEQVQQAVQRYLTSTFASGVERRAWNQVRNMTANVDRVVGGAVIEVVDTSAAPALANYVLMYTSREGRAQHYVPNTPEALERRNRGRRGTCLCGTESFGWVEESRQGQGRVAERCAQRARNMGVS